jgi:hypothetical protein
LEKVEELELEEELEDELDILDGAAKGKAVFVCFSCKF